MSLRDRVLSPCAWAAEGSDEIVVDVDALLMRLLLFDTYVLDSHGLKELPKLVALFGYDGVIELLDANALKLHPYRLFAGHLTRDAPDLGPGQMRYSLNFEGPPPTRPGFFEITNIKVGTPSEELHTALQIAHTIPGLTKKQTIRLKREVAANTIPIPEDYTERSTGQTHRELDRDIAGLRRAVAWKLSTGIGAEVVPNAIDLSIQREGEIAVFIESNLCSEFDLSAEAAHAVVGESLLALSRLNARLEDMEVCSAISGTRPDESFFVENKYEFVAREIAPNIQIERFQRVLEIFALPELGAAVLAGRLRADAFIALRNSQECVEFRQWLRGLDDATDDEIKEHVDSLRARVGNAAHSGTGKVIKVVVTTAIGLIPVAGVPAAAALSGLDAFLGDRLLPESGPALFLTKLYPSVFI